MGTKVRAPITGSVWRVVATVGDRLAEGDLIIILESMKMEIPIEAEDGGTLVSVHVHEGQAVSEGDVVAEVE
jgi:acetyl-CoA carboxylase biotin carboxyl carrier protein